MIENLELNNHRNRFIATIIQSIQIEMDEFMMRVANKECYESMIHQWAVRLFEKGSSPDYAINVIHRARRYVLINRASHYFKPEPLLTLEKILTMLNKHLKYNELDKDTKLIVQKKVAEMFNNNARIEAIEEVLEAIDPHLEVNKEKNRVTFVRMTIDRIMNSIRQWNLTGYWQNRRKQ